jgi:hypothetical protein
MRPLPPGLLHLEGVQDHFWDFHFLRKSVTLGPISESKNSTAWCARDTSPGSGTGPCLFL